MLKVINATDWYPAQLVKDITVLAASGDEWLIRLTQIDNLADGKDEVEFSFMGPNGWTTREEDVPDDVYEMSHSLA